MIYMNGWLQINWAGSIGLLDLKLKKPVAAAALVPSSFTSILALCKAWSSVTFLSDSRERSEVGWNRLPTPMYSSTWKSQQKHNKNQLIRTWNLFDALWVNKNNFFHTKDRWLNRRISYQCKEQNNCLRNFIQVSWWRKISKPGTWGLRRNRWML